MATRCSDCRTYVHESEDECPVCGTPIVHDIPPTTSPAVEHEPDPEPVASADTADPGTTHEPDPSPAPEPHHDRTPGHDPDAGAASTHARDAEPTAEPDVDPAPADETGPEDDFDPARDLDGLSERHPKIGEKFIPAFVKEEPEEPEPAPTPAPVPNHAKPPAPDAPEATPTVDPPTVESRTARPAADPPAEPTAPSATDTPAASSPATASPAVPDPTVATPSVPPPSVPSPSTPPSVPTRTEPAPGSTPTEPADPRPPAPATPAAPAIAIGESAEPTPRPPRGRKRGRSGRETAAPEPAAPVIPTVPQKPGGTARRRRRSRGGTASTVASLTKILIVVALVGAAAAGGWWWYQEQQDDVSARFLSPAELDLRFDERSVHSMIGMANGHLLGRGAGLEALRNTSDLTVGWADAEETLTGQEAADLLFDVLWGSADPSSCGFSTPELARRGAAAFTSPDGGPNVQQQVLETPSELSITDLYTGGSAPHDVRLLTVTVDGEALGFETCWQTTSLDAVSAAPCDVGDECLRWRIRGTDEGIVRVGRHVSHIRAVGIDDDRPFDDLLEMAADRLD